MKKIRLLLIENEQIINKKNNSLNKSNNEILIIARSSELKNTLAEIKELNPCVVLINVALQSQSCFSIIEIIQRDIPSAKIVVSGLEKDEEDILKLVQSGVNGFILKNSSPKEFIRTIKSVDSGSIVLPPLLVNNLFSQIVEYSHQNLNQNSIENDNMTNKESEVMGFLCDGMSNKEIGNKMQISTFTVKCHIHNIMEKLSLHTRLEIANHYFYSIPN